MPSELVIASLNRSEVLGGFARGYDDQRGIETRLPQFGQRRFSKQSGHVRVGNHGTSAGRGEPGTFAPESLEETGPDFDGISAVAKRHVDSVHGSQDKVWASGVKGLARTQSQE